jgi:delta8-fatty-acid desaturase
MPYDAFAQFFVPYQNYLYYPILLFGRFNLYFLSFEYLIRGLGPRKGSAAWHRYFEISGMIFFWYWFCYGLLYHGLPTNWDRFCYVMISHMVTMPLHVQITLSHFAMSTADLGVTESFPQKMLRTTMDVDCSEWLDFFHGGLHLQVCIVQSLNESFCSYFK